MGDLVSLQEEREKRTPHMSGPAHCLLCGHKEIAVAPVGVIWMECSNCKSMKMVYDGPVLPPAAFLACQCGNQLLYLTIEGPACPNCGESPLWPSGPKGA